MRTVLIRDVHQQQNKMITERFYGKRYPAQFSRDAIMQQCAGLAGGAQICQVYRDTGLSVAGLSNVTFAKTKLINQMVLFEV